MPLLKITGIIRKMRLAIQSLTLFRNAAHPADLRAINVQHFEIPALIPQLLCHSLNVHAEVVPQEIADLCVFVVAGERGRGFGVGGVDVDVCGGVAVCAPSGLRAARHHVGVGVQCGQGRVGDGFDFLFGVVVDAEAVDDAVDDEDLLLLVRRRGEKVRGVFDGEALG